MKTILVSALVLNGSKSGYRRILRNLIIYQVFNPTIYRYIYVFQESGWRSLGLDLPKSKNCQVIIFKDFKNKWTRGLVEQIAIPFIALKKHVNYIFMPATFGLFLSVRPIVTFVHTNTHFVVDPGMRGRSRVQQYAHLLLTAITRITSSRLAFTSEQTFIEYQSHSKGNIKKYILGNGIIKNISLENYVLPRGLLKNQYFLSVSQFYRLKNFDSLISAFIKFKDGFGACISDFKLVIVGTIQEADYYQELIDMADGRDDIYFMHDLSDEALGQLFINARGYCFYSRFEGYSLTPGEALLSGINIAISDIPTHKEIYKDLPFYADPNNVDSIASSLIKLYEGKIIQKELPGYDRVIADLSFEEFNNRLESIFKGLGAQ